jgi:hypothetical protein
MREFNCVEERVYIAEISTKIFNCIYYIVVATHKFSGHFLLPLTTSFSAFHSFKTSSALIVLPLDLINFGNCSSIISIAASKLKDVEVIWYLRKTISLKRVANAMRNIAITFASTLERFIKGISASSKNLKISVTRFSSAHSKLDKPFARDLMSVDGGGVDGECFSTFLRVDGVLLSTGLTRDAEGEGVGDGEGEGDGDGDGEGVAVLFSL